MYGYCLDDPVNGIDPSGLGARWDMLKQGLGNFWEGIKSAPGALGEARRNFNDQFFPAYEELYGDKGPYEETTVGDRLLHTSLLASRFGTAAGTGYPGASGLVRPFGARIVGGVAGFNAGLATQGIAELTRYGEPVYEFSRKIRSISDDGPVYANVGTIPVFSMLKKLW